MFRIGYNTNGLAHHRPVDALRLVAELGYEALALTPDVGCLDPFALGEGQVEDLRGWSEELGVELVVETGARFLLDARRKHRPNLLEEAPEERDRRVDLLARCVDLAEALGAPVVSFWSGAAPDGAVADWPAAGPTSAVETAWARLVEGTRRLLDHAGERGVRVAFEPEPGMFVATAAGYGELVERLGSDGAALGLTLDVGHCVVTGEGPAATIARWGERLWNVHLDDCRAGEHLHRMFGEGDLDLAATLRALVDARFAGVASVELSRDSHRGPEAASEALAAIRAALGGA